MKLKDIFSVIKREHIVDIKMKSNGVNFSCLGIVRDLKSQAICEKDVSKIYACRDDYDCPVIVIEIKE